MMLLLQNSIYYILTIRSDCLCHGLSEHNPLPSDRLRCCDRYIRCQRSLAVKPLNSRHAMSASPSHIRSVRRVSRYQFTHVWYRTEDAGRARWQQSDVCVVPTDSVRRLWLRRPNYSSSHNRACMACSHENVYVAHQCIAVFCFSLMYLPPAYHYYTVSQ